MAATAQLTLTTTWQSLGVGPLEVQTNNQSQTLVAISDAMPVGTNGFFLQGDATPQVVPTTSTVWARARVVGSGPAPVVIYAPAVLSSGGGSGGSVTQGTTPWVDNVSQFGGSNVVTGTGVSGAGIPRVTVSSDSTVGAAEMGSSAAVTGIVPVVTAAGTSAVGKTSQGNLYSAYAVNSTTTAGYLVAINAAAVPAAGAAIAPLDVAYLAGAVGATAQVNYGAGPPNAYSTGIVVLVTTSLTTYIAGGNAFIQVRVR